jgi:hypothetical protein
MKVLILITFLILFSKFGIFETVQIIYYLILGIFTITNYAWVIYFKHLFYFFLFLVILEFVLMVLHLLDRHFTSWATTLALFTLLILETGSCFLPRSAWTTILLFYTSHNHWGDRHVSPPPAFSRWDRSPSFAWAGLKLQSSWSQPPK